MEPRRRFRADISNDYARLVSSKKLRRLKPKLKTIDPDDSTESSPSVKLVTHIPNDMIPRFKEVAKNGEPKNYSKPENWIKPKQEEAPSRDEVMEAERNGVKKALDTRIDYSRAARSLKIASDPNRKTELFKTDQEIPSRNMYKDKTGKKISVLQKFFEEAEVKLNSMQ